MNNNNSLKAINKKEKLLPPSHQPFHPPSFLPSLLPSPHSLLPPSLPLSFPSSLFTLCLASCCTTNKNIVAGSDGRQGVVGTCLPRPPLCVFRPHEENDVILLFKRGSEYPRCYDSLRCEGRVGKTRRFTRELLLIME